uniref:DNA repair protein SWI5 homolog n=1 Tax=Sarcophilus harrisii TaxID=9305 RepID=A0A7N4NUG2_SARHA
SRQPPRHSIQQPPRRSRSSHREGEGRGRQRRASQRLRLRRSPVLSRAPVAWPRPRRCLAPAFLFLTPWLARALVPEQERPSARPLPRSLAALESRSLQKPSGGEPRTPGLRRARLGLPKRHSAAFRSPVPAPKFGQANETNEESLRLEIQELKQKRDTLDQEISQLMAEGYVVSELEDHISLLHEYNDIKDVGQMLMGKLARIRGVTTKELYWQCPED